ncbi:MAG: PmbA/TldA family metallopeptidase, partial [Sphingomonas sp.]
MSNHLDTLDHLLRAARAAGADAADALFVNGASLSVQRRLGKMEQVERAEGQDIGLRVFVGRRSAIVSTTDPTPTGFADLAERAVAMARAVPEDPFGGLPDRASGTIPTLDLCDSEEPEVAALLDRCAAAEDAALAVKGVTNTEGAEAGWSRTRIALAATNGFAGAYMRASHSISVTALAGSGTGMERDYDYAS